MILVNLITLTYSPYNTNNINLIIFESAKKTLITLATFINLKTSQKSYSTTSRYNPNKRIMTLTTLKAKLTKLKMKVITTPSKNEAYAY
jgi:hypothetical protein